ncbi:hypothetical protein PMM47T1_00045 [Pseudomonas sp. M47T1]|uniref:hypothetical protein n=1 Tax=unclassified Pseudomonas TaxID=196821 RepID=UPI0002606AC4|nr:hypothetical protein [Pseudomonas sp. M47T1]EIK98383.1 hypothetical protein PMM47T1_00045 [Pseudomonas sp. M47T1]
MALLQPELREGRVVVAHKVLRAQTRKIGPIGLAVLGIVTCTLLGTQAFAATGEKALAFKDYPVAIDRTITNHPYVATQPDSPGVQATRRAMALQRPNLAGHYVAYGVGCGGGAMCGEVIDVLNGKVVASFPDAYLAAVEDEQQSFDFTTRADSRMIIVGGIGQGGEVDEHGRHLPDGFYTRYYEFDGHVMKLIRLEK